jgi:hypothetical protein
MLNIYLESTSQKKTVKKKNEIRERRDRHKFTTREDGLEEKYFLREKNKRRNQQGSRPHGSPMAD